jgi:hypothetical protein
MASKYTHGKASKRTGATITDRGLAKPASAAETAEYVALMCAELGHLASSSAEYITAMTCELATLASSAKLERLSVLLESVRKEAESAV